MEKTTGNTKRIWFTTKEKGKLKILKNIYKNSKGRESRWRKI